MDARILLNNSKDKYTEYYGNIVWHDTYIMCRNMQYNDPTINSKCNLKSFYETTFDKNHNYSAHNALDDVMMTWWLHQHINMNGGYVVGSRVKLQ